MGKQVSVVTGSMSLYSTRPNAPIGTSQGLASGYLLNRAVVVNNSKKYNNRNTVNNSTSLMKNGFLYGYPALWSNAFKTI